VGAAALAATLALGAVVATAGAARAEPSCVAGPPGDPFATCFDPGNRLVVGVALVSGDGLGGAAAGVASLAVRHVVSTEDPDVFWRLEHVLFDSRIGDSTFDLAIYRGRFIRHSRDGRIVLPTSPPRKLFLPFDLGAEAALGAIETRDSRERFAVGVLRTALFVEVLRSPSFRRRVAFGAAGRWDVHGSAVDLDLSAEDHHVAPLSLAMAAVHLESASGLTVLDLAAEGGRAWSSATGWRAAGRASASLERVLVAVEDRPLSLYAEAGYAGPGRGKYAALGVRLGVIARSDAPR
jgi:hypothetical protein